jgi:2-iminobutanoate/2-iminopropanoate deaminase
MRKNERSVISTERAPAAIGPYSQAVRVGHLLFTSGQIALDPATGDMVGNDRATGIDVAAQTHRVMQNLRAVLAAAGASLDDVVKATIFVTDLEDFATINDVYGGYFTAPPPARSTVQVAALPRHASVEIEVVAVVG